MTLNQKTIALGCAAALAASAGMFGSILATDDDSAIESVYVPIVPCRLVDTRPGSENVGPVNEPLAGGVEVSFEAWGFSGGDSDCDIPSTAVALSTNTTAVSPTAASFLTLFPTGATKPNTSNLNYLAGQAPTANSVVVPLSDTGAFSAVNHSGTVHLVVDVVGYYHPSTIVASPGPAGPAGPKGANGRSGTVGRKYGRPLQGIKTLAGVNATRGPISVAVDAFGNPILAYEVRGATKNRIELAYCHDPSCSDVTLQAVHQIGADNQGSPSIAIGSQGYPVISFVDRNSLALRIVLCTSSDCSTRDYRVLDSSTGISDPRVTIDVEGNPIVAYLAPKPDLPLGIEIRVARCNNPACTDVSVNPIDTITPHPVGGPHPNITIDSEGQPVVSYLADRTLMIAFCDDLICSTFAKETIAITALGSGVSLTHGVDGNPILAYAAEDGTLTLAVCSDTRCTSVLYTDVATSNNLLHGVVTVGPDGNPIIAYTALAVAGNLHLAACATPECASVEVTDFDPPGEHPYIEDLDITAHGQPLMVTTDFNTETIALSTLTSTSWTQGNWES